MKKFALVKDDEGLPGLMTNVRKVAREQRDLLGEGPVWCARLNSLFWVDIVGQAVNQLHLATSEVRRWSLPERIGWIQERALRTDFLAGLKSGVVELSLEPLAIQHLVNPEPERPQNRLNDSKVDGTGRLWFGSKDDSDVEASGALYRMERDGTVSRHDDGYKVTNGPAFSLDQTRLYHTDSDARTIYVFSLQSDGALTDRRVFLRFPEDWGYPDGMTTDAEDGLWVAHWGGARISRFLHDGRLDRSITMPAKNITSIAFAGEGLHRMFVTSAVTADEGNNDAGGLFEVEAGVRGAVPTLFAG